MTSAQNNGLKRAIMILIRSPLIRDLFIASLSKVYSSNQPLKFLNGSVVPYVYHKLRERIFGRGRTMGMIL